MKTLDKSCFICGNKEFIINSNDYLKCTSCCHEIIKKQEFQSFIVNEILSLESISKKGLLDKFKQIVLKKCTIKNDLLLDVGSSSGKFLYQNKLFFKNYIGIEVTEECIAFARNQLGLKIEKDIDSVNGTVSVATFWHSLEHMPHESIERFLDIIRRKSSNDTRIIVSVPNNESLQYAMFGKGFAFYDLPNHIHQFSVKSLDKLMERNGFKKDRNFFSFPYSSFGYLQGFLNKFNKIHNYLYYRKKRGQTFDKRKKYLILYDAYNYCLILLLVIPSLLFSIYDLIFLEKGGVITVCYRKEGS